MTPEFVRDLIIEDATLEDIHSLSLLVSSGSTSPSVVSSCLLNNEGVRRPAGTAELVTPVMEPSKHAAKSGYSSLTLMTSAVYGVVVGNSETGRLVDRKQMVVKMR